MSLALLIDELLALIDRKQRPFDYAQFEVKDRAVYVEADRLGLSGHMPRPSSKAKSSRGYTNLPVGLGTFHEPQGYYYAMESQIPEWRSQMLTLRALAENRISAKTEVAQTQPVTPP